MNRNRHGIIVENNTRKVRRQPKQATPCHMKTVQPILSIERAPLAKFNDYVELQRYEDGLQVILVTPYFHQEVQELKKDGWRVMQRWKAPKYAFEKRAEDVEHLQAN